MELKRVPYKWIVAAIFVTGLFMDIMDSTIVNVAIPSLVKDLHTTAASVEWVVLGYLLSLAVWIPASGWVGDRIGTKKTFLFALFAFTAASALCGLAQTAGQLIAFRILQGVGGGMLTPVGTAMLFRAFPPSERAKASAVLMIPAVFAPALGPVVGGWLVTDVSWRLIFYVNVPVGIAGFIFGALFLKEHREPKAGSFDIPGFVLSGAGLALALYALSEGPRAGWTRPNVLAPGILGVAMFVALIRVELRAKHPMLDLRLFRERMFRNANIVMILAMAGMIGVLFLLPQFLQNLRGLSALQSGLATFPQAVGMMVAIRFVAKLYPKVGPRRMVISGLLAVASTTFGFLFIDVATSLWWIRGLMFLRGISMAVAFIPMQAATYSNISRADTGRASALFSTQRQVGSAFGVAILATVWLGRTKSLVHGLTGQAAISAASVRGYHDAFFVAALLALVAMGAAFMIRDSDALASLPATFGDRERNVHDMGAVVAGD